MLTKEDILPTQLNGALIVVNNTTANMFMIDKPQNNNYVQLLGDFPATIGSSSEFKAPFNLSVSALWNSLLDDKLNVPVKMSNADKTVDGTLKIYTLGGEHYPDFVVFELDFNCSRSVVHKVSLSLTEEPILDTFPVGDVNILISDAGTNVADTGGSPGIEDLATVAEIAAG